MRDIRDRLMFGESNIGDGGHETTTKPPPCRYRRVCGCNGVTKARSARPSERGSHLDEVRKHTKASASCAPCTGLVEQLLMFTAGATTQPRPR